MYTSFFIFLKLLLLINGKYVCDGNVTVFLEFNEAAFFETPDYPKLSTLKQLKACQIKFTSKNQNQRNFRIIVAYNGNAYEPMGYYGVASYGAYFFLTAEKDFTFFPPSYGDGDDNPDYRLSIQGVVVIDDGSDNCPLESLSSPFAFKDETQIIYLKSDGSKMSSSSCQWSFTAPDEYGFKIVFTDIDPLTNVLVTNTTDIIVNKRSLKLNRPYYNSDKYIQINLYYPTVDFSVNFFASVSIVKKQFNYTDGNCTITKLNNNTVYWTNIYYPLQNYVQCSYMLTIPAGVYVGMMIPNWSLEKNVDILQYYWSENDIVQIPDLYQTLSQGYMLKPNYDGTERNVLFEYKSDGSIPSMGFTVEWTFFECKCNPLINCIDPTQKQTIMGIDDERYCGNLYCNITIQSCSSSFGVMKIYASSRFQDKKLLDIFKVISNGEMTLKIYDSNRFMDYYYVYLNSSNTNYLQVITNPSLSAGHFSVTYAHFYMPTSNFYVYLTSNVSYYVLFLNYDVIHVVEICDTLKSKNLSLFIYRFHKDYVGFSIFNNQSLTYNLNGGRNCFKDPNPYRCEINSTEVALFQGDSYVSELVAVRLSDPFDGCIFHDTLYPTKGERIVNISALANEKNICDIILLIRPGFGYTVTFLWTTAASENVKVFIGLNKTRLYFEFNSVSSKRWQNIGIFSSSYIIEIPKNAALLMKLENVIENEYPPMEYPYHSLIATPAFGTIKWSSDDNKFVYTHIGNVSLKYTALYYNMSAQNSFYFQISDSDNSGNKTQNIYINKTGDSVAFDSAAVTLIYNVNSVTDEALFFIETINNSAILSYQ